MNNDHDGLVAKLLNALITLVTITATFVMSYKLPSPPIPGSRASRNLGIAKLGIVLALMIGLITLLFLL